MKPQEALISETFIRSSGPGGQHVNKVSSAVELRYDAARDERITQSQFDKLRRLAGRRITQAGVIILRAEEHRSQDVNRRAARQRLEALLTAAQHQNRKRRPTRPSKSSKERRLKAKAQRGHTKTLRQRPDT